MAEANDGVEYWISMIKDHVDFNGSEGQEVHDFYSGLDDAKQQSFSQFMRKEKNRIITGIEVQKASGGGTNKYLKIDMNVFKSCLNTYNINTNINQMDIDIDNNNNDNDDNNDNYDDNDNDNNNDDNDDNSDRGSSHVSIHMCVDFSAVLGLSSQNVQDVLIQDVFIVSYLDSDGNVINDAYHFHSSTDVIIW